MKDEIVFLVEETSTGSKQRRKLF